MARSTEKRTDWTTSRCNCLLSIEVRIGGRASPVTRLMRQVVKKPLFCPPRSTKAFAPTPRAFLPSAVCPCPRPTATACSLTSVVMRTVARSEPEGVVSCTWSPSTILSAAAFRGWRSIQFPQTKKVTGSGASCSQPRFASLPSKSMMEGQGHSSASSGRTAAAAGRAAKVTPSGCSEGIPPPDAVGCHAPPCPSAAFQFRSPPFHRSLSHPWKSLGADPCSVTSGRPTFRARDRKTSPAPSVS